MKDFDDPVTMSPRQLVASSKVAKNFGTYLNAVRKQPLFIARDSEIEAVLISLEDYRELLLEEERIEDLYLAMVGLRRLVEHLKTNHPLLEMDDVLAEFGLTREALEELPDDEPVVED